MAPIERNSALKGDDHARGLVGFDWVRNADVRHFDSGAHKKSYLDVAVHSILDPAFQICGSSRASDEITGYAKSILKTAPLFMSGSRATLALVSAYAADEAKVGDSLTHQTIDSCLGASKSLLLKGTFSLCEAQGLIPGATGLALGISARTIESGLTRSNYYDAQGRFCLQTGLYKTGQIAFNPTSLAVDALCYGAADALWSTEFPRSSGRARNNPMASHAISGAVMGMSTGFSNEIYRQMDQDGTLDWKLLARRSLCQGTADGIAGALGGWQKYNHLRLPQRDSASALAQARSTPIQTGKVVDRTQRALRDGLFIPDNPVEGLTTQTWQGRVRDVKGREIPAIFRPDNQTPSFAQRMQAEIACYGLSQLGWFEGQIPATVARKVKIAGKEVSGFIQELRGSDLSQYFAQMSRNEKPSQTQITDSSKASQASSQFILEVFRSDPALQQSYKTAWLKRMIIGEWDNHAMNMVVDQTNPQKPVVVNIDLDGAVKPAVTKLDLIPQPGIRRSWEATNSCLYQEISGSRISPEVRQRLFRLLDKYETPQGRQQVEAVGLTPMQADGVLGRTRWFAEHGVMPVQQEPLVASLIPLDLKRTLRKWLVKDFAKTLDQTPLEHHNSK